MVFLRIALLAFLMFFAYSVGQAPPDQLNGIGKSIAFTFFITAPLLYFLPTLEARARKHPSVVSIGLVNLFLGWTLLGWVVAIAWAHKRPTPVAVAASAPTAAAAPYMPQQTSAYPPQKSAPSLADELQKLAGLKASGVLTEEEFQAQKQRLLSSAG